MRRHLPLVLEQAYPDFEVIVVDDASSDATPAVLRDLARRHARLRVLRLEEKKQAGKKAALALGIQAARYAWVVMTDADCRPASAHWLGGVAASAGQERVEMVLGYAPFERETGFFNGWARYEVVQTALHYLSFALAGMPYMGVGRNLAWKKTLFEQVGGFARHAHLAGGDDDLFVNAAARPGRAAVVLQAETFVYSSAPAGWRGWLRQKRRHVQAGLYYQPRHQLALGVLALSHVLHFLGVFLLLMVHFGMVLAITGYIIRQILLLSLLRSILPRLDAGDLLSRVPIYDLLLAVYYGVAVPCFWLFRGPPPWK